MSDLPYGGPAPAPASAVPSIVAGASAQSAIEAIISPGTPYYLGLHGSDPTAGPWVARYYEVTLNPGGGSNAYQRQAITFVAGPCSQSFSGSGGAFGVNASGTTSSNGNPVQFVNVPSIGASQTYTSLYLGLWSGTANLFSTTANIAGTGATGGPGTMTGWYITSAGVLTITGTGMPTYAVATTTSPLYGSLVYSSSFSGTSTPPTGGPFFVTGVTSSSSTTLVLQLGANGTTANPNGAYGSPGPGTVYGSSGSPLTTNIDLSGRYLWGSGSVAVSSAPGGATLSFATNATGGSGSSVQAWIL